MFLLLEKKNLHSSSWFILRLLLLIKSAKCFFYHIWTGHQRTQEPVYVTFTSASNLILAQSYTQVDCCIYELEQVHRYRLSPVLHSNIKTRVYRENPPKNRIYVKLFQRLRDQGCLHIHWHWISDRFVRHILHRIHILHSNEFGLTVELLVVSQKMWQHPSKITTDAVIRAGPEYSTIRIFGFQFWDSDIQVFFKVCWLIHNVNSCIE